MAAPAPITEDRSSRSSDRHRVHHAREHASIITGMTVLARKSYARRVFGDVSEGAVWLLEESEQTHAAAAFVSALEQLRGNLRRHEVA